MSIYRAIKRYKRQKNIKDNKEKEVILSLTEKGKERQKEVNQILKISGNLTSAGTNI